jgi:hypothetical protein
LITHPLGRAKRGVSGFELLAGGKVLTLAGDTFEVVDVVLPAVLGLFLIGNARFFRGVEFGEQE